MYYVQFLDKNRKSRAGGDASLFIRDLKTLRGVINRIRKYYNTPDWAKFASVASCTESTKYQELKPFCTFVIK